MGTTPEKDEEQLKAKKREKQIEEKVEDFAQRLAKLRRLIDPRRDAVFEKWLTDAEYAVRDKFIAAREQYRATLSEIDQRHRKDSDPLIEVHSDVAYTFFSAAVSLEKARHEDHIKTWLKSRGLKLE